MYLWFLVSSLSICLHEMASCIPSHCGSHDYNKIEWNIYIFSNQIHFFFFWSFFKTSGASFLDSSFLGRIIPHTGWHLNNELEQHISLNEWPHDRFDVPLLPLANSSPPPPRSKTKYIYTHSTVRKIHTHNCAPYPKDWLWYQFKWLKNTQ